MENFENIKKLRAEFKNLSLLDCVTIARNSNSQKSMIAKAKRLNKKLAKEKE